jgi:hypothetical protein
MGTSHSFAHRLRVEDVSVIDLEGLMIRAMSYVMSVTLSSNLHQCYRHKILTCRRECVSGLRRLECCTDERYPDTIPFETDPPTLIAAQGMSKTKSLLNKQNKCIAVIGDGAVSGWPAKP